MICRVGLSGRVVGAPGCSLLSEHLGVPFCRGGMFTTLSLWVVACPAPLPVARLSRRPRARTPRRRSGGGAVRGVGRFGQWRGAGEPVGVGCGGSVSVGLGWLLSSVLVGLGWLLSSVLVGLVGRWVFCFFLRGCIVVGCRHRLVAGLASGSATFQRI